PSLRVDNAGRPRFDTPGSADKRFTLADLGQHQGIRLQGNGGQAGMAFSLRRDEVASAAYLELELKYSPALLDEVSYVDVLLNGVQVERVFLGRFNAEGLRHEVTI